MRHKGLRQHNDTVIEERIRHSYCLHLAGDLPDTTLRRRKGFQLSIAMNIAMQMHIPKPLISIATLGQICGEMVAISGDDHVISWWSYCMHMYSIAHPSRVRKF